MNPSNQPLNRTSRIRTIFLERRRRYSLAEISRLAGITERKVIAGIEAGEYVASRRRGEYRFTWSELAHIAMAKWPLPVIHDALGTDAALALPPLLLPQELHVRLPAYQVHASPARRARTRQRRFLSRQLLPRSRRLGGGHPRRKDPWVQSGDALPERRRPMTVTPRAFEPHEKHEMSAVFGRLESNHV
jgi:hypothetical protein